MTVLTGNNVRIAGDLNRGLIRLKIDPRREEPWTRTFPVEPPECVREHRVELVRGTLDILKGYVASGFDPGVGRLGSFEIWSDFIRCAVPWTGS